MKTETPLLLFLLVSFYVDSESRDWVSLQRCNLVPLISHSKCMIFKAALCFVNENWNADVVYGASA